MRATLFTKLHVCLELFTAHLKAWRQMKWPKTISSSHSYRISDPMGRTRRTKLDYHLPTTGFRLTTTYWPGWLGAGSDLKFDFRGTTAWRRSTGGGCMSAARLSQPSGRRWRSRRTPTLSSRHKADDKPRASVRIGMRGRGNTFGRSQSRMAHESVLARGVGRGFHIDVQFLFFVFQSRGRGGLQGIQIVLTFRGSFRREKVVLQFLRFSFHLRPAVLEPRDYLRKRTRDEACLVPHQRKAHFSPESWSARGERPAGRGPRESGTSGARTASLTRRSAALWTPCASSVSAGRKSGSCRRPRESCADRLKREGWRTSEQSFGVRRSTKKKVEP